MSTQQQLGLYEAVAKSCSRAEVGAKGQRLKREGMKRAATRHDMELCNARNIALELGRKWKGIMGVDIEAVRSEYERFYGPWDLGNASGSVFTGPQWEWIGFTNAKRPAAHCRLLRVWRLKR